MVVKLVLKGCEDNRSARIPIMGPGGMGKTTVAAAILHHPGIKACFGSNAFFVKWESINSSFVLVAAIMKAFGFPLDPSRLLQTFVAGLDSYTSPAIICL